jgi:hypothetical protein
MNRHALTVAFSMLLVLSMSSAAWEYYTFDLPSETRESAWRDALAAKLHGQKEVTIEGGRIDVLTATQAIEVDRPHKWHEGLGQALHYADVTGKQGVVALVSYSQGPEKLREKSRRRFDLVERQCEKNGIKLVVLFPSMPSERAKHKVVSTPRYWLNTASGTRHNIHCRFYHNTRAGRPCSTNEGAPCSLCGG